MFNFSKFVTYSCNKIGRACQPDLCSSLLHFLQIPRKLRYSARLAYLIAPSLKSPHRAFLWLTRGCLRQKRRRLEWSLAALISSLNCDCHLATAPISVFILVGVFAFTTPILWPKLILQTRQNWKVGCGTNLYVVGVAGGRAMRRKWFTTPTLSPAWFSIGENLSRCRNADYISFFFSVGNLLLSLIFLWIRISEATHKEILRYSKSETR